MAKRKTTELTTITAASLAAGDWFPVVDVSDTTMSSTGTNKKLAKSELAEAVGLTAHLADTTDAHDASAISFSATGTISSTDVQAAIAELDSEKAAVAEPIAAAHISDTSDAHDASAISVLDTAGNYTATDVEAVLAELPSRFAPLGGYTNPLNIPTYDDNPDVTHPDVIDFGTAWNGWRYWMVATPYPDLTRENPSILVSQDGISWSVPAGLTNPVFPQSTATGLGYTFNSDGDIVYDSTIDSLVMFWKVQATGVGIARSVSTDGVTWKTPAVVLTAAVENLTSPSVVIESNGNYTMWTSVTTGNPYTITKRTSTDRGLTWGSPTTITAPTVTPTRTMEPWHLDVVRLDDRYYMLVDTYNRGDGQQGVLLYLWESADGSTWYCPNGGRPIVRPTQPNARFYRSTLQPVPGTPTKFDIWACEIDNRTGTEAWRIVLFRNVDPTAVAPIDAAVLQARAGIGYIVGDTFSRADSAISPGNADTGQAWTVAQGTMGISSGQLYFVASNPYATIDAGVTDVEVAVDFGAIVESYIIMRMVDGNNRWRIGIGGGNTIYVQKIVSGSATVVDNSGKTMRPGDRMRVRVIGNDWTLYVNDRQRITWTDSANNTGTKVGLQLSLTGALFDNFTVRRAQA